MINYYCFISETLRNQCRSKGLKLLDCTHQQREHLIPSHNAANSRSTFILRLRDALELALYDENKESKHLSVVGRILETPSLSLPSSLSSSSSSSSPISTPSALISTPLHAVLSPASTRTMGSLELN